MGRTHDSARKWTPITKGMWIGQPYIGRGDTTWCVILRRKDYRDGKQSFVRGGPDRATAEAVATQLARRLGAIGSSRVTVGDVLRGYEAEHIRTLRGSTEELQRAYIRNHLIPRLGARIASELGKADLFDFGAAILAPLEGDVRAKRFAVVKNCLSLLRAALRWYWREHQVAMRDYENPAVHVSEQLKRIRHRFSIPRRRRRPAYTPEHIRTLVTLAQERGDLLVHDLFVIAVGTGMRLSEILGIRWANIDELRGLIVPDERGELVRMSRDGNPTLYKSERDDPIAMPLGLLAVFRRRRQTRTSDEWVFADDEGHPWKQRWVAARIWKVREAAKALGVPIDRSFHSTRHTFASIAHELGRPTEWIKNQVGHASAAFTADQYVHLLREARDDMDAFDFSSQRSQSAHSADSEAEHDPKEKRLN